MSTSIVGTPAIGATSTGGHRLATVEADLDALAANFTYLKALSGSAEVAPVVQADAYGLGNVSQLLCLAPILRRLPGRASGN